MADLATDSAKNKDTDFKFTVGKPLTQVVVGDRANVIVPVVLDLKERGKPNRYDGLANVVLLKTADVWKIGPLHGRPNRNYRMSVSRTRGGNS